MKLTAGLSSTPTLYDWIRRYKEKVKQDLPITMQMLGPKDKKNLIKEIQAVLAGKRKPITLKEAQDKYWTLNQEALDRGIVV